MSFTVPSNVSANQFYLLASALAANANAIATTALIWQNGANATNSISLIARVYRNTGTLSLMAGTLRLNATIIQPITAGSSALLGAAADPIQFTLSTNTSAAVMPVSGDWDLNVTSLNTSGATVNVEIWGLLAK